jgi:hypothetical protein
MDVFLGLLTLAFVVYFVFWEDFLRPLLGLDRPKPVKSLPPLPAYKSRSRVRNAANAANAGSAHQGAKSDAQNVPANVPGSGQNVAAAGAPGDAPGALLITQNELQQLAGALAARATGATLDEAILRGFGLKKGGGPSYKRAKELFDTATKAP